MMLEGMYLRSHAEFGKDRFTAERFARFNGITTPSAKVLLHRLVRTGQVLRVGRGEHVLLSPVSFLKRLELEGKNRKLHSLALEVFRMFPGFGALVLYGSQVRGDADRYSDYDVLLVLPEKNVDSEKVRQRIEKKLGIKLHLTIYSKDGYRNAVLSEPYIRFWLAEGIIFDEDGVLRAPLPPVPKMAYEEWLSTAKTYLESAGEAGSMAKKGRYYLTALEIGACIGAALLMDYDFSSVKKRLEGLVGRRVMLGVRSGRRVEPGDAALLRNACGKELKAIAASLDGMGDNEADIYWKRKLVGG